MKKYKKIFGFLFPSEKGTYIKLQDVIDKLFPLAYGPLKNISREDIRKIVEEDLWGSPMRALLEVRKKRDDFYEFLDASLAEKVEVHQDRYKFTMGTLREWVALKFMEYRAFKEVKK